MGLTFPDSGLLSGLTSVLGKSTLPPTVVSIFRVIRYVESSNELITKQNFNPNIQPPL